MENFAYCFKQHTEKKSVKTISRQDVHVKIACFIHFNFDVKNTIFDVKNFFFWRENFFSRQNFFRVETPFIFFRVETFFYFFHVKFDVNSYSHSWREKNFCLIHVKFDVKTTKLLRFFFTSNLTWNLLSLSNFENFTENYISLVCFTSNLTWKKNRNNLVVFTSNLTWIVPNFFSRQLCDYEFTSNLTWKK